MIIKSEQSNMKGITMKSWGGRECKRKKKK